jgi:hypothetical protein
MIKGIWYDLGQNLQNVTENKLVFEHKFTKLAYHSSFCPQKLHVEGSLGKLDKA